ncbi:mechanosensitive ion channel family protein [Trujillonella endophytica]|uniref:Small conductance mechanosensitive channel n=1 Tax=Trujillonella endophytica TaxID=673521 RepID=A0A1H8R6L7_9ACTN|nr:mechanosensitive ion channel family protein [Trujillella endophytica]SEO61991.1 small conductance mechanosensitive channel [Trujillella endophytica]
MTDAPPAGVCGPRTHRVCEWVYEQTGGNATLAAVADWLVGRPLAIAGVLLVGWVLRLAVRRLVHRGVHRMLAARPISAPSPAATAGGGAAGGVPTRESARRGTRAEAVAAAVTSLLSALVWVLVLIAVLGILGVDLGPVIAGAGLLGIAVAFGAQSLIRDLLAGVFILLEDHFAIGDEVDLGEAVGTVEKMTFRETVLRDLDGTVWHVRNGLIDRVGNQSQVWSGAMVDVAVAHGTDLVRARELLHEAAATVSREPSFADDVLEPPEVLGVHQVDACGITVRLRVKTRAGRHFDLQRALLEAITTVFPAGGVQLATPQLTVRAAGQVGSAGRVGGPPTS